MSFLIPNDIGPDVFDLPTLKQLSSYHSSWNPDLLTFGVLSQLCQTSNVNFHSDQTDSTVKLTRENSESQWFS